MANDEVDDSMAVEDESSEAIVPLNIDINVREVLEKRPLSPSSLKAFRNSPRHYLEYLMAPKKPTEEMFMGSLVDCLLLEKDKFEERYLLASKINRGTKQGKLDFQELIKVAAGRAIVQADAMETAKIMVESIMDCHEARMFLDNKVRVQHKLFWKDRETGLPNTGIVDFDAKIGEEWFVVDLKTSRSSDPEKFIRQALDLDYIMQPGSYLEGYRRTKYLFPQFVFLVVENVPPYLVTVNYCDSKYLDKAKAEFRGTLNAFKYCLDNDQFKMGYEFRLMQTRSYFTMSVPGYYKPRYLGFDNKVVEDQP